MINLVKIVHQAPMYVHPVLQHSHTLVIVVSAVLTISTINPQQLVNHVTTHVNIAQAQLQHNVPHVIIILNIVILPPINNVYVSKDIYKLVKYVNLIQVQLLVHNQGLWLIKMASVFRFVEMVIRKYWLVMMAILMMGMDVLRNVRYKVGLLVWRIS
jgi:hypothetical protein